MIHVPCGSYNEKCPCMKDRKCTKKFPRQCIDHTQEGNNGYPLYKRRSKENGGNTGFVQLKGQKTKFEIEDKYVKNLFSI